MGNDTVTRGELIEMLGRIDSRLMEMPDWTARLDRIDERMARLPVMEERIAHACSDIGEVKVAVERQNGRLRTVEGKVEGHESWLKVIGGILSAAVAIVISGFTAMMKHIGLL